jgi:diphthamide synthase subunit DPH2
MNNNKEAIKALVIEMLNTSHNAMLNNIDKVLSSGCVDTDSWDSTNAPMILPKCIVTAILKNESEQYTAKGTSFENRVKKEVSNIRLFL